MSFSLRLFQLFDPLDVSFLGFLHQAQLLLDELQLGFGGFLLLHGFEEFRVGFG